MKKIFLLLITLNCSLTFAQEKTYSFNKKLSYNFIIPEEYKNELTSIYQNKLPTLTFYIGNDALLGNVESNDSFDGFNTNAFFATNNKIFDVNASSLENNLSIKLPSYYNSYDDDMDNKAYSDNFFGNNTYLKKLNTTETINGLTCDNYELISKNYSEYDSKTTICIDSKNEIDNIRFLIPNQDLKGLLVKISTSDSNGFVFNNTSKTTLKSTFDEKKSIETFNKILADQKAERENYDEDYVVVDSVVAVPYQDNYYDDPINMYYNYATSSNDNVNSIFYSLASLSSSIVAQSDDERNKALNVAENSTKQIVKQYKKNKLINNQEAKELNTLLKNYFNDAKNYTFSVDDAIADYTAYKEFPTTYDTYYNKLNLEDMNFAYTDYSDEDLINTMPKYCTKSTVPNFSNKEFKKNVENYIGQLCDLYLSKYVYNVGITETTDALRYSFLKINELKNKLSKEEQTQYDQFINNLD